MTRPDQPVGVSLARPKTLTAWRMLKARIESAASALTDLSPRVKEPASARHPLDRAEGVFDRATARHHQARIGVDPRLHPFERGGIDESMDRPLDARRAPRLQSAVLAGRRSVSDCPVPG